MIELPAHPAAAQTFGRVERPDAAALVIDRPHVGLHRAGTDMQQGGERLLDRWHLALAQRAQHIALSLGQRLPQRDAARLLRGIHGARGRQRADLRHNLADRGDGDTDELNRRVIGNVQLRPAAARLSHVVRGEQVPHPVLTGEARLRRRQRQHAHRAAATGGEQVDRGTRRLGLAEGTMKVAIRSVGPVAIRDIIERPALVAERHEIAVHGTPAIALLRKSSAQHREGGGGARCVMWAEVMDRDRGDGGVEHKQAVEREGDDLRLPADRRDDPMERHGHATFVITRRLHWRPAP